MKFGTHIVLPDGRKGTVVYHNLDGYGIVWEHLDFGPDGAWKAARKFNRGHRDDYPEIPEPEAMLRDPWPGAKLECVGAEYTMLDHGTDNP